MKTAFSETPGWVSKKMKKIKKSCWHLSIDLILYTSAKEQRKHGPWKLNNDEKEKEPCNLWEYFGRDTIEEVQETVILDG